jgi:hypothetical protein
VNIGGAVAYTTPSDLSAGAAAPERPELASLGRSCESINFLAGKHTPEVRSQNCFLACML